MATARIILWTLVVFSSLQPASTFSSSNSVPSSSSSSSSSSSTTPPTTTTNNPIHTLILTRHGDSIWNGGHPGHRETFTGWTDVPLSPRGVIEASQTAAQISTAFPPGGIDACFTSILGRATLTAHECLWTYGDQPSYVSDYRLNERHYGALQGYAKADVESGLYGHDPKTVEGWRRSWGAVPPLLGEDDPRRLEEVRKFGHRCGGIGNVPRGESLEMVARDRVRPFLDEVLTPVLDAAAEARRRRSTNGIAGARSRGDQCNEEDEEGGTGLVVAHANSLRALIGVVCEVEGKGDAAALSRLERMKIQTGVPLVLRYRRGVALEGKYEVCGLPGLAGGRTTTSSHKSGGINEGISSVGVGDGDVAARQDGPASPELPVWPLSSLPRSVDRRSRVKQWARETSIEFDVL